MRDRLGQALYVGKAGDLRTRVRSYFGSRRQPPRIEGALAALASDRRGAHRIGARGRALRARSDPPLAAARATCATRGPTGRSTCGWRWPTTRRRSACASAVRDDGAVYAGPFPSRRLATEAAEALRDGYGLRTCRPRVPVDDGRCLRGAAGRCLAPCRGGDDALAYARSARALAAWLAGEEAVLDAPLRERVARLIAQHRFEDARRTTRLLDALRAADAQVASIRRAGRRTGVLLAADLDPRHVVAFAVVRGALVAKRRLPRAGDPGLELGAVAARARARARSRLRRSSRAPRAPGCRPSATPRRSCSRRPSQGARRASCPIACAAPDALALKRVDAARRRVPLREPLPPGRHPRADELAAVA